MHQHHKLSLCIILHATLITFYFPSGFCASNFSCDSEFDCGSIGYLTYPFWGGNRPQRCGRSGFELVCRENVPMLNISSLAYRVLDINFITYTLKVARDDLSSSICPQVVRDTSIDLDTFKYPSSSTDVSVTLYYDCKVDDDPINKFRCSVNGVETINLFDARSSSPKNVTCKDSIFVPINEEAANALREPTASSINTLRAALDNGFSIQWLNDGRKLTLPFCDSKIYGSCIAPSGKIYKRACDYVTNCSHGSPQAPGPEEHQGPPPVQNPRSPTKSEDNNTQTGNGKRAPVQSPVHPPESGGFYPTGGADMPLVRSPESGGFHTTRDSGRSSNKTSKTLGVIFGVIGIFLLTIISIAWFIKRRGFPTGPNEESNYQAVEDFLLQHGSLAPKRYKYSEIKKMTKSLSDKLGQGGYGSVYKGKLLDGSSLVAVKVLSATDGNGEDFINEVASISRTSHVNVVNLLGFCFDRRKRALVYEYMPNKSLDKYIGVANTDCRLDLEILYKIAVGVAKGLEYLHTGCNTRIIHFDIKPQNILLDEEFCPKISDFGLAKLCKKKQSLLSMLGTRGTVGYIAPEVFSRNFGGVSHKSDVYSYGMMVLEMAGANTIVDQTREMTQSSESYFPDKIYEQVIVDVTRTVDGFVIEDEEETTRKMVLVGFWCIQTNPSDRPSISKVVEMLEGSVESIQIPPKPVLCNPTLPVLQISSSVSSCIETEHSAGSTHTLFKVSGNGSCIRKSA